MARKIQVQTNMASNNSPQFLSSTSYEDIPDPDYTTAPSRCDICSKVLVGVSRLSKHLARVHKAEIEIKCKVCGESFRRNKAFVQHLRERHIGQQQSVHQDVGKPLSGDKERKKDLSSAENPSNIHVAIDENNYVVKSEKDDSVWDADDFSPPPSPPMETELEKGIFDTSTSSDRANIIPNTIQKSPVAMRAIQSSDRTVTRSSVKRLTIPSSSDGKTTTVSNILNSKPVINGQTRSKAKTTSDIHLNTTVSRSLQAMQEQDLVTNRQQDTQIAALGTLPLTHETPAPPVIPLSTRAAVQPTVKESLNTSEYKSPTYKSVRSGQRRRKQPLSTPLSDAPDNSEATAPNVSESTISIQKLKACIASVENFYEDEEPCFEFEKRSVGGDEYHQCIIYRVCKISSGTYNCSLCKVSSVTEPDAKNHFVQAHSELILNQCSDSPCVLKFANINELVSYQERFRGKEILLGLDTSCRNTSVVGNEASSRDKRKEQKDSGLAQDSFHVSGAISGEENTSEPELKDCLWDDDDVELTPALSPPCSPLPLMKSVPVKPRDTLEESEEKMGRACDPPNLLHPQMSEQKVLLDGDATMFEQCSHTGKESHRFVLYKYSKIIDGLRYCTACERPSMNENGARRHFVLTHKELLENACSDSPSVLRFTSQIALESYRRKHKRNEFLPQPKFKCDQCERCFSSQKSRRYHQQALHGTAASESSNCEVCGKVVPSTSLARHLRRAHTNREGLTPCTICNKSVRNSYYWPHMLRDHKNYKQPVRAPATCSICHKIMPSPSYKHRHMITAHGREDKNKRRVDCQVCGENLALRTLRKHMERRHGPTTGTSVMELCSQCGKTFANKANLRRHVFSAHSGRSAQTSCSRCLLDFESEEQLQEHKLEKHVSMCEICGLSYPNGLTLSDHLKTHLDPEQRQKWVCESCGWTGLTRGGLTLHKRTHLSKKPFQCEFCDFRCSQRPVHITHIFKIHFGPGGFRANAKEKKGNTFVCNVCTQAYPNDACLQFHLQYHKEEKQFACNLCSESFHTKYDLLRHKHGAHYVRRPGRRTTSSNGTDDCVSIAPDPDSRGWKCLVCDKKFDIKTHAKIHWRVKHLNETPFPCTLCGKGYKTTQDLAYHTRAVHTKEAAAVCSVCGMNFYSKSNWRVHMKTHDKKLPSTN